MFPRGKDYESICPPDCLSPQIPTHASRICQNYFLTLSTSFCHFGASAPGLGCCISLNAPISPCFKEVICHFLMGQKKSLILFVQILLVVRIEMAIFKVLHVITKEKPPIFSQLRVCVIYPYLHGAQGINIRTSGQLFLAVGTGNRICCLFLKCILSLLSFIFTVFKRTLIKKIQENKK